MLGMLLIALLKNLENHPIETEEWIVSSLTQTYLTNIIVSPLRNTNTSPKVLVYVAKLLSLPFALRGISHETKEQIKKVFLEVKLVSNLIYSSKKIMKVLDSSSDETTYKNIADLTEEDFEALECVYMLITHLVHLDNEFLSQLCDSIAVLNVYAILKSFLLICKSRLQLVMDLLAILTHVLRVFPEHFELVNRIVLSEGKSVNFVELLRHNNPLMQERTCFFLLFLGKHLPANKVEVFWNETVRETLEVLMYDSIGSVRNQLQEAIFNGNLNQVDKIIAETLAIQWNRIELLAQENSEELNRSDELVQVAKIRKLNKNVITTGRFDRNETTPLTAAILSGKLDEAKVLLEEGTDSCKADSNQQTPLLAAVRSKSLEAVRLLLHYGANLTIPTAFLEAINLNCSEIVKYFIENGADVNKQYRDGFTPLTKAIDNGNVKIVKVLLNSGADVNLANDEGETPLRIATNKRSIFIVYLLVEKGADMDLAREDLEEFAEDDEDFYTYYQNLQMNNSNSY
ncbi:Serine/threonine-protein kinase fused-like Protein [Tribolium castaneum]|uniref:Serine/threonine-protein kinase fused-like Protein n=1 Tax=Tribolium castaneum TaxID=7070 RepID=A0A139WA28_TRICA|nr:Serine/threonine-protein kinase fused-like Protein [Tribolium castaneum]